MPRLRPGALIASQMNTRDWSRWCDQRQLWEIYEVTSTAYTAGKEELILVDDDTAGGVVTITLPVLSGNTGIQYVIKKMGTTANVVVDGADSETIDGQTTQTLSSQYQTLTVVCADDEWVTI